MGRRLIRYPIYCLIGSLSFVSLTCVEDIFVPPIDLFVEQRLEPNPKTFTLGSGPNKLTIKTNQANVTEIENGIRIRGSLFAENNKYGDVMLTSGDFVLLKSTGTNSTTYTSPEHGALPLSSGKFIMHGETATEYVGFAGVGLVELPNYGIVKNLQILDVNIAPMGFILGSELEDWPVSPNRYYFYTNLESPIKAEVGNSSLSGIKRIAIDPYDPYFYVSCDFEGSILGPITNIGFAVSAQGIIPYNPSVTIYKVPNFKGNLYLTGTIDLLKFPASITGETVIGFYTGDQQGSENFFQGKESKFNLGFNGKVNLEHDLLDFLDVEIVLGKASLFLKVMETGDAELYFVGIVEQPAVTPSELMYQIFGIDWEFLDYLQPQRTETTLYGTVGTVPSNWELGFKQKSYLDILGKWKLDMGETAIELNSEFMYFKGESSVAGFNRVGVEGKVNKSGDFILTGYKKSGFDLSAGPLSLSFSMGMNLTVALQDAVFTFKGKIKLSGEACAEILGVDLCADFSLKAEASISTNGSFKICFKIGISDVGFDVCLSFSFDKAGKSIETMTVQEIPIEMVPLENRFQPKTGQNELQPIMN